MSKAKREAIVWTEAHQVEAWARIFEIAAVNIRRVACPIPTLIVDPRERVWTEALYRRSLQDGECFDADRIDREVRRVDRLARGVDVRETVWEIRSHAGAGKVEWDARPSRGALADARRAGWVGRLRRVTRIRKSAPR